MSTEVCAIVSGKGGVGKSSIAFFLANILAGGKSRTILLDMNIGLRGLEIFFRQEKNLVYDLGDVLDGKCTGYHDALMSCRYNKNCYGIAAPSNPFFRINFDAIYGLISDLKRDFDYVILDCPPAICSGFISSVSVCDRAIVVTTPDPLSVSCATKIAEYIRGAETADAHFVINGVNFQEKRPPIISDFDTIIDQVGLQLLGVIPFEERLYDSVMKGRMVPKGSDFSKALYNLARRYNKEDVPLRFG